jgi:hypothetical protein
MLRNAITDGVHAANAEKAGQDRLTTTNVGEVG